MVGLENLDRGELIFISRGKPEKRPLIGYVFQSPRLLPWKTIGENISLALQGADVPRRQWESRVTHYLNLVGLEEYVNQFPLYLSGGQRQRVGLARALAIESDIVLMDVERVTVERIGRKRVGVLLLRFASDLFQADPVDPRRGPGEILVDQFWV